MGRIPGMPAETGFEVAQALAEVGDEAFQRRNARVALPTALAFRFHQGPTLANPHQPD